VNNIYFIAVNAFPNFTWKNFFRVYFKILLMMLILPCVYVNEIIVIIRIIRHFVLFSTKSKFYIKKFTIEKKGNLININLIIKFL